MSDETVPKSVTFSATLLLAPQQREAFEAVGKERGTFADWEGRYVAIADLRALGLAISHHGRWSLTTIGRQIYKQAFGVNPA